MKLIMGSSKRKVIAKLEKIPFKTEASGIYLLEVSARTRNKKQLGGTDDEDLRIEIDQENFPSLTTGNDILTLQLRFLGPH